MTRFTLIISLLLVAGTAHAEKTCTAIVGAKAYLPSGPTDNVTVVIRGAKIESAKANTPAPKGCEVIAAGGKIVTPGLVDVSSQLGLVEVGLEAATVDFKTPKGRQINAAFVPAKGLNRKSTLIPIARMAGITSTITGPAGGLISGQSSWIDLTTSAALMEQVAMRMRYGSTEESRASSYHKLVEVLDDARIFAKRKLDWERGDSRPFTASRQDLMALQPVLKGKLPVVMTVNRAADITRALYLAKIFGFKLVIEGGVEAHVHAKTLAKRGVAVILNPTGYLPASFDHVQARRNNAALLHKAGVKIMFSSFWTHNMRTLAQVAGNAVRAGLPHEAAIKALTATPAEVFGKKNHGQLAKGKVANVVMWSGDPLELSSHPEKLFIGGVDTPLISRQSMLRDRYLKGYTPEALPLP